MKTTLDKPLLLKELPAEERPREKLLAKGPQALSNAELLAILLRTGTKNQSVMRLAEGLLAMQDGLAKVSRLTAQELSKIKGIGAAKAVTLVAAMELGKRLASLEAMQRAVIRSPQDIRDLMMPRLRYETKEHFVALLLSTKNHVLAMPVISVGNLNASLVHPRELFREAINHSAAAVALVHNHPSGDPTPSREDIEITRKMIQAGEILGIAVLDHVIIGDGKYVSLKEKGII
ncbi:RadC family protein [Sporolituus thermophilus]|uniref:DNA replication and repair protein RadC n=1 Tax=Sporolituus thermophilus DSM 23256 TaxID=1123285 RepID=A0A1G7J8G3_9FIRM|nr:DNA repair protein RadC [Sporolituus thermophilus]SDF21166.1 DNA replication and repair protein RadC [Sporolituus thermophilus DSM 23256]